ncbi:hypothetical protein [Clostridium culturomicium]|uniref:hypothetical protein n=1 Tax=Clostridium culturomicium TaxID=1499683 RepID=UPI0038579D35
MRIKSKKPYLLKRKILIEDNEGGKYTGYSEEAIEIKASISPASGKLQAEIYGERLNYILNMLYDGNIELKEGDGICYTTYAISTKTPDYKIISIKPYSHLMVELEKIL